MVNITVPIIRSSLVLAYIQNPALPLWTNMFPLLSDPCRLHSTTEIYSYADVI